MTTYRPKDWKPGDVARVTWTDGDDGEVNTQVRLLVSGGATDLPPGHRSDAWWGRDGYLDVSVPDLEVRPLVVIDPEDREQVALLLSHYHSWKWTAVIAEASITDMQAALREFARPTDPTEPRTRVTDRRDNIWRLLADGDWVCTSGPDSGEYIAWSRLAAERGPLTIEVPE